MKTFIVTDPRKCPNNTIICEAGDEMHVCGITKGDLWGWLRCCSSEFPEKCPLKDIPAEEKQENR